MHTDDFRPPERPTPDQQCDALQKGLGRAHLWAAAGRLDAGVLLEACLNNQCYDSQVEPERGDWLWGLLDASGFRGRMARPLLARLAGDFDAADAGQLCTLALRYAQAGAPGFREALYGVVRRKPVAEEGWFHCGEEEILALDGLAGLRFAVRQRLEWTDADDPDWRLEHERFVEASAALLGREVVDAALRDPNDADMVAFGRLLEAQQRGTAAARREPAPEATFEQVVEAAEANRKGVWLRAWGRGADPSALALAAERLWRETDPGRLSGWLRIFAERALPEFDERLIALCRHPDEEVRNHALVALRPNAHPAVRAFALELLASGNPAAIGQLTHNFEPGDEERILSAARLPEDEGERHWVLYRLGAFFEANPAADPSRLGVWWYAETPCGECRHRAAAALFGRGVAPDWLRAECRRDADPETRALAGDCA